MGERSSGHGTEGGAIVIAAYTLGQIGDESGGMPRGGNYAEQAARDFNFYNRMNKHQLSAVLKVAERGRQGPRTGIKQRVLELSSAHSDWTLQRIADNAGCCRDYVYRVLKRAQEVRKAGAQ